MCSEDYDAECRTTTTGHSAWYTQLRADRVDKFPDEFSVTVTADDEQLSVAGCVHEYMAGPPWGHQTGHVGALVGSERLLDGGLKLKAGIRFVGP